MNAGFRRSVLRRPSQSQLQRKDIRTVTKAGYAKHVEKVSKQEREVFHAKERWTNGTDRKDRERGDPSGRELCEKEDIRPAQTEATRSRSASFGLECFTPPSVMVERGAVPSRLSPRQSTGVSDTHAAPAAPAGVYPGQEAAES